MLLKHRLQQFYQIKDWEHLSMTHLVPSPEDTDMMNLRHGAAINTNTCNSARKYN